MSSPISSTNSSGQWSQAQPDSSASPESRISESPTKADIVSSEAEPLILVDANDKQIGTLDKSACHNGDGVLHRAFSLFIFNDAGELLLQQRASGKRLWPGYWSNSCCSHPRAGETMEVAVARRLEQELGMAAELNYIYKFQYQAHFEDQGSEHELCSVYLGSSTDAPTRNVTEIQAWQWISQPELERWLSADPGAFTPWFKMEWQTLSTAHDSQLDRLLAPSSAR